MWCDLKNEIAPFFFFIVLKNRLFLAYHFFLPGFFVALWATHISCPASMSGQKHAFIGGNILVSAFGTFIVAGSLFDVDCKADACRKQNKTDTDKSQP